MATPVICKFNQFGYCKYKEMCRKQHENKKCENISCELKSCTLRQPKLYKFFREYCFCKFGEYCKFIHFEKDNHMDIYKKENEMIMKKLANIDKQLEVLHQHEEEIVTKRSIDDKISELEKIIADKDVEIDILENCFNDKITVIEENIIAIEKKMEESPITNQNDERIKSLERKIHISDKRRLGSDFCDFCDLEFKSGCEKDRKETAAHIRHTHTFECNIFDLKLNNKEELEIHLQTCEMYTCSLCIYRHKRLSKLKSHCKNKHTKNTIIRHSKMDRDNSLKVSSTNYFSEEI
jgi:hypothetical protein